MMWLLSRSTTMVAARPRVATSFGPLVGVGADRAVDGERTRVDDDERTQQASAHDSPRMGVVRQRPVVVQRLLERRAAAWSGVLGGQQHRRRREHAVGDLVGGHPPTEEASDDLTLQAPTA